MTTLAIMATYEKKRLKCYGTVAAGEHVAVTVTDGAQWIGEGKALRLRVLFGPDTVGVFPFADGDAWTATGTQNADAYCELNLNTLQAEKYLKHGGTCLWILDDVENHTLYATGEFDVLPWPKRRGIDEPIDLDGYPLLLDEIEDLKEAFEEYQRTVAQMLATKQDTIFDLAAIRSGAAAGATAVQPSQIARFVDDAEYKAQYGEQNKPAILFKHGTNVIVALDATPFVKDGMVSSVAVVGGNLVITFNTDAGQEPIEIPLTDIFDPDNYYDKTAADGKFVAKADVAATVTQDGANPVKSSGIWSAIWGALIALPTGFTSLYDWCVSQLARKQDALPLTYLAKIAAVSDAIGFDATHSYAEGDPVVYAGVLYTFTEAHTGEWTGTDVLAVDIIARLAETRAEVNVAINQSDYAIHTANQAHHKADQALVELTDKANRASNPAAGNLAALDANGNPTDSGVKASDKLDSTSAAPAFSTSSTYAVGDHVTYNGALYRCTTAVTTAGAWDASKWTADMASNYFQYALVTKTITNGAVSLDDRAINAVAVSSSLASLTINFPTATSGKARDFGLRLTVASGITTAPELALPQGVICENADGEAPEIGADGAATILYFTETASGVFLVKGEVLQTITA